MNKVNFLVIFCLLFGIQIGFSQKEENFKVLNNQLVYEVDDLKNGEFLHDFMLVGPFPNLLPEGVTDYFHLEETCLGFSKDYLKSAGGEKDIQPYIGQDVTFDKDKKLAWQKTHTPTDKINLKKIFSPNDKGYKTGGVAWFEPANELDILQTGKKQPNLFLGIMHSAWAKFEYSLLPVAEANWTGKTILGDLKF